MNKRILIAGGSGLLGSAISRQASALGWECFLLSRKAGPKRIQWSPGESKIGQTDLQFFDAIINLAGENVSAGRWTEDRKQAIYKSRLDATLTLESYLRTGLLKTDCYIGASAMGIYGHHEDSKLDETTPIDIKDDWFIRTVVDWEKAHQKIAQLGIRTVMFRIGLVLGKEGGALFEILEKAKPGILPVFGSGRQVWSWIHIDDMARMFIFAIEKPISGIYNAAAPNPVTNKELIQTIGNYIRPKKLIAPVPKFVLSVVLGEMHRVLFDSTYMRSDKIEKEGFQFEYPTVDKATQDLLT